MSDTPLISFITPCFNRCAFLMRCINSIPLKYRSRVEHIIVDGGSTDGSVELIKSYPHVRLLSEPDDGLYDAANKGIQIATGKYIGFLATDDFISSEFFEQFFDVSDDWMINSHVITFNFAIYKEEIKKLHSSSGFNAKEIFQGSVPVFSILIRRDILNRVSGFNASYRIAGDFELALRLLRLKLDICSRPYLMQNFWMHEHSLTGHSGSVRDKEYAEVVRSIFGNFVFLIAKRDFAYLARQRIASIAQYFYRTRHLKSIFFNWRLMVMILLLAINFR